MKKTRALTISELSIDVVDYLLFEWLRRRGVLSAFMSNCGFDSKRKDAFRIMLRHRIQKVLRSSNVGIGDLISVSFIFSRTPEGLDFWFKLSFAWRRFCTNFLNNFK